MKINKWSHYLIVLTIWYSCNPRISEKSKSLLEKYIKDFSCSTYSIGKSEYFDTLSLKTINVNIVGCSNYNTVENDSSQIDRIAKDVFLNSPDTTIYNGITIEFSKASENSPSKKFIYYYNRKTMSLELVLTYFDS